MTLNPTTVILFSVGVVLMYAAVHNQSPMDVFRGALGKPTGKGKLESKPGPVTGQAKPQEKVQPLTQPGTIWVSV